MSSTAISTVIKIMETLPLETQEQVAEYLREYISDLQAEARWDASFQRTQTSLIAAAHRPKQEIAEGKASAMDYASL